MDMRTQAFGDSAESLEELLELMKAYEKNGFNEKKQYADMREELLPYRDNLNCERIYTVLKEKFSK